jgi:hypothetical protein
MAAVISFLTLYSWVLVGCVIGFLLLIARFYEIKYAELYEDAARKRTYYQLYPIPVVMLLVAAVRYTVLGELAGDLRGDLAFLVGGIVLAFLGFHLQNLMTGGRR